MIFQWWPNFPAPVESQATSQKPSGTKFPTTFFHFLDGLTFLSYARPAPIRGKLWDEKSLCVQKLTRIVSVFVSSTTTGQTHGFCPFRARRPKITIRLVSLRLRSLSGRVCAVVLVDERLLPKRFFRPFLVICGHLAARKDENGMCHVTHALL